MKLQAVRIRNFRSFEDVELNLGDYTCLIGPNGTGKSTVLTALNVFFRETANAATNLVQLSAEDFHRGNTVEPIEIILTFADLEPDAKKDFAHYVRLDKLTIMASATFDPSTQQAEVMQFGERLVMKDFMPFFEAYDDGAPAAKLRSLYADIRGTFTDDLPNETVKDKMHAALRAYEEAHPELCHPARSSEHFYGVSRGSNLLARFVQWVYVPAVKSASDEEEEGKNTALGKLLERTVRQKVDFSEDIETLRDDSRKRYKKLLDANQSALNELSTSLQTRLATYTHPQIKLQLEWREDPDRSVRVDPPQAGVRIGEHDFLGSLARLGHGVQRSYLLAVLQELAAGDDEAVPRLMLGCEEPELYQHPPQARHLADVLEELSHKNAQVILTSHSPLFVSGDGFPHLRLVRRSISGSSRISSASAEQVSRRMAELADKEPSAPAGTLAKVHAALNPELNEMFFCHRLLLVEGQEDIAYITTYLHLLGLWPKFRSLGCHIVATDKKSLMLRPVVLADQLGIPSFLVFDADGNEAKETRRKEHERDNTALLRACEGKAIPFPTDDLWGERFVMWSSNLASVVAKEIGESEWAKCREVADAFYGHVGNMEKNPLHVAFRLNAAWDQGKRSTSLEKLCTTFLAFAEAN